MDADAVGMTYQKLGALLFSWAVILVILVVASQSNYLLFHTAIELASIVVSVSIFVLAWNSQRYCSNQFFSVLGVALLCTACLDLLHTMVYKGMGVFPSYGPNIATQLWIAARYLHSFSFVLALSMLHRPVRASLLLALYAGITVLGLWSILSAGIFPDCFIEGRGLTTFKKASELLICGLFGLGLIMLQARRELFGRRVYLLLSLSVVAAICAEFAFVFYVDVYGISNMVGHLFKLISVSLLYVGVVRTGLREPLEVVFRELKQKDEQLVRVNEELVTANELLEQKVAERTADLHQSVDELHLQTRLLEAEVSERQKAQEELKVAKEAAEAASRAKSAFLANMSHELRTPLSGVVGMAQLLGMSSVTDEQKEYLDILQCSADNLSSLISDILDITKIESEQYTLNNVEYSFRESIGEVVKMLQRRIEEKNLSVHIDVSERIPELITGDRLRFMQIISNLLSNAIKFTEQGEVRIGATVKEHYDSTLLLEVQVSDTGIGIAKQDREQIFQLFTQVDDSYTRRFGGAGLGLAICRKLTELMGGSLWVESEPEQGSTFHLLLPCNVASRPTPGQEYPVTQESNVPVFACSLPVLVAEDNPANLKYAKKLLEKLGCKVTEATDGRQALEAWEKGSFKLILMDIQMPELRGDEVVRTIRQREQDTHVPIIAVTAHALNGDRERFLEAGCDGYVAKPFLMGALADAIRRLVEPGGNSETV